MGWVSPTGFVDGGGTWSSEALAYDENTGTYAVETIVSAGWGNYLELTHLAINCDKVQVWSSYQANIDLIEVDVYYSSAWYNLYSGAVTIGQYVEYAIGSTQSVTAMRIRYHTTKRNRWVGINEADFWEVSAIPTGTVYLVKATGRRTQLDTGAVAIRIDPATGRRSLDTALTKFLVREDDGTLRAKSP